MLFQQLVKSQIATGFDHHMITLPLIHPFDNYVIRPGSSVTRYFARQLLNKHAKNYQNVEKITTFLLSTKVV
jgi:hypothetical protein